MNFITLKISIFYGYTKPLQSDAKWRLIHSLYSFWQLLYTWLAWICSCKDIHCIVQCKVFEQATVECRQHIPANSFEILSFWNAVFIFLPRELDFSCKLFCGVLDWNLQNTTLFYSSFNQWQNCGDIVLKRGNFGKQNNPHPSSLPTIQN